MEKKNLQLIDKKILLEKYNSNLSEELEKT